MEGCGRASERERAFAGVSMERAGKGREGEEKVISANPGAQEGSRCGGSVARAQRADAFSVAALKKINKKIQSVDFGLTRTMAKISYALPDGPDEGSLTHYHFPGVDYVFATLDRKLSHAECLALHEKYFESPYKAIVPTGQVLFVELRPAFRKPLDKVTPRFQVIPSIPENATPPESHDDQAVKRKPWWRIFAPRKISPW